MSERKIYDAVVDAVLTASLPYPINWPNQSGFVTPKNAPWLRVSFLTFGDLPQTLGSLGYNENNGTIQIDLFVPKGYSYPLTLDAVAAVKAVISSGANITYNGQCVKIKSANVSSGGDDDIWHHNLIIAEFSSFTQRGF